MRVLLDATAIPADRTGVGRYVDALVPRLAETGIELVVVAQPRDEEAFRRAAPDGWVLPAPAPVSSRAARFAWEQTGLPDLVRRTRADVVHDPHYTMPVVATRPRVVTLHDATFFSHPELHTAVKGRFFRAATRVACSRAAALIVPSRATRDELVRHVGVDPDRVTVAHLGVDTDRFRPVDDAERRRVARSLGLEGRPYIAFLGTLEPRKNVPALIRGWIAAFRDHPEPPALVLAGGRGWDPGVDRACTEVPDTMTLLRPGYLPLDDLAGYLSGATVVAYPSLGEGFGLPVLEAMSCGAAVLTTRELSLAEVGGDAVAYCGTDPSSIASHLEGLIADPGGRVRLATKARERAAGFSWRDSARRHVLAYRAAADASTTA